MSSEAIFDLDQFVADIPEALRQPGYFDPEPVEAANVQLYGAENRLSIGTLAHDEKVIVIGGIVGRYVKDKPADVLPTIHKRVETLTAYLSSEAPQETALRINQPVRAVSKIRGNLYRQLKLLRPDLQPLVESLGGMYTPLETKPEKAPPQPRTDVLTDAGRRLLLAITHGRLGSDWVTESACRGNYDDSFNAKNANEGATAIAICKTCPAIKDCLVNDLTRPNPDYGIRDGMTRGVRLRYITRLNEIALQQAKV